MAQLNTVVSDSTGGIRFFWGPQIPYNLSRSPFPLPDKSGIILQFIILQFPTMDEMTEGEKNFALKVEEFLSSVPKPEYRQLLVEVC